MTVETNDYRKPAPQICASRNCSRSVDAPREPYASPSPLPEFCSWGCWNGAETRKMFALVKAAKAMPLG